MHTISKEFHFSAAHSLPHLPPEHPCYRLHGHNYTLEFFFAGEPDPETGFVLDYRELDCVKKWIDDELDHRNLDEIIPGYTTIENITEFTYREWKGKFPSLVAVEGRETPKTLCRYERP